MKELFLKTKDSIEHPIYHPEKFLNRHIFLVTLKAMFFYDIPELVMAGLFHDIMKPQDGDWKGTAKGPYWSNPLHAVQASEYVMDNDNVRYFIKQYADVEIVRDIIYRHMDVKDKITRKAKAIPYIDRFRVIDDMIDRYQSPSRKSKFIIPQGKWIADCHFIGMSPLQVVESMDSFTITLNRTPFRCDYSQIPLFFNQKWKDLRFIGQWLKENPN